MLTPGGTSASESVVVRPSSATHRKWVGQGIKAFGILVVVMGWRVARDFDGTAADVALDVGLVVVVCCVAGVMFGYLKTSRVSIFSDKIEYVGFFGRHTTFALSDVDTVLEVTAYVQPISRRPPISMLVLLPREGRKLLRLNSTIWAPDGLEQIVSSVGVPPATVGPVSPKELAESYPGAVTTTELHPWRYGLLSFLGVMVLAVGYATLTVS